MDDHIYYNLLSDTIFPMALRGSPDLCGADRADPRSGLHGRRGGASDPKVQDVGTR